MSIMSIMTETFNGTRVTAHNTHDFSGVTITNGGKSARYSYAEGSEQGADDPKGYLARAFEDFRQAAIKGSLGYVAFCQTYLYGMQSEQNKDLWKALAKAHRDFVRVVGRSPSNIP